ncbi:MAG TPA: HepT-like ribonuclease domain-containing protein [Syntrophales bacterium]|nr:HepT-like ribonuclease domain-containing protein [Syntrophales bacterium]
MVDKTLILRKLVELETYREQLREFSSVSIEEYSGDWKTQRIVERTLQIMIELCKGLFRCLGLTMRYDYDHMTMVA